MNYVKIFNTVMVLLMATTSLGSHRIGFDKYHNFEEMTDYLKKITNEFSNITSLYSIGKSVLSMNYKTNIIYNICDILCFINHDT